MCVKALSLYPFTTAATVTRTVAPSEVRISWLGTTMSCGFADSIHSRSFLREIR